MIDVSPVLILVAVVVAYLLSCLHVLKEYERAVVFRLGRLITLKGPGLLILVPAIDRMERVSLRTVT
ncbi:MAG: SPFH domain-containing protein, partial [Vicinamibacterales bacterium]